MQNQAAKDDPIAARKAMLDRVVSDFTFKANQTDDQKTLWNSIDQHFSIFHSEVLYLFEDCPEIKASDEYKAYRFASRNAQRWFNTAVANDYDDKFDMDTDFQEIAYPGPQTNPVNERVRLCESVNKSCFDLVTRLTQILPHGRALSVAVTVMQEVRGWLLDAINFNMPKQQG